MTPDIDWGLFPWITLVSEKIRPPCFKDLTKCPDKHLCKDLCVHLIPCRLVDNDITREDVAEIIRLERLEEEDRCRGVIPA